MFKKICGWVFFILGLFFALGGVLAMFGGAGLGLMLRLLMVGGVLVSGGWRMRGSQNQ